MSNTKKILRYMIKKKKTININEVRNNYFLEKKVQQRDLN